MYLRQSLTEIYRRNPVLAITGWIHLGLFFAMLAAAPFDPRQVMGLNPWIKPMKFALSITLFVWTTAWFTEYVRRAPRRRSLISWGISIAMLAEITGISLQAARGVTSHYNVSSAFDAVVFTAMGIMILVNTLLLAMLLVLFFTVPMDIGVVYRAGIRLGLAILILGSGEGMAMIAHGAHTVGLPDGGPGLPLANWSTRGGDLRVAHFLGLHAYQILPLAAFALERRARRLSTRAKLACLGVFSALYAAVLIALLAQAMRGRPLISS